ncbi:hypothetical protein EV401DRAFT_1978278 [Pisolithus croceorrhizus]|nr:hypothetical protein EV401DRAFT_1978278 [Pisolithus croceorrhizus]
MTNRSKFIPCVLLPLITGPDTCETAVKDERRNSSDSQPDNDLTKAEHISSLSDMHRAKQLMRSSYDCLGQPTNSKTTLLSAMCCYNCPVSTSPNHQAYQSRKIMQVLAERSGSCY